MNAHSVGAAYVNGWLARFFCSSVKWVKQSHSLCCYSLYPSNGMKMLQLALILKSRICTHNKDWMNARVRNLSEDPGEVMCSQQAMQIIFGYQMLCVCMCVSSENQDGKRKWSDDVCIKDRLLLLRRRCRFYFIHVCGCDRMNMCMERYQFDTVAQRTDKNHIISKPHRCDMNVRERLVRHCVFGRMNLNAKQEHGVRQSERENKSGKKKKRRQVEWHPQTVW